MFDLVAGKAVHTPSALGVPVLASSVLHLVIVGAVIVLP